MKSLGKRSELRFTCSIWLSFTASLRNVSTSQENQEEPGTVTGFVRVFDVVRVHGFIRGRGFSLVLDARTLAALAAGFAHGINVRPWLLRHKKFAHSLFPP